MTHPAGATHPTRRTTNTARGGTGLRPKGSLPSSHLEMVSGASAGGLGSVCAAAARGFGGVTAAKRRSACRGVSSGCSFSTSTFRVPAPPASSKTYFPRFWPRTMPSSPAESSRSLCRLRPAATSPALVSSAAPLSSAASSLCRRMRARVPFGSTTPVLPQSRSSSNMIWKTCPSACSEANRSSHFMQLLKDGQCMQRKRGPTMHLPPLPQIPHCVNKCRTPRPLTAPARANAGAGETRAALCLAL
mmetsp:Transcript_33727/g.93154  ORF Transcript_33727/g.93154 Transcript_33727/m.93154 type:complete len:246 (+) Transcript_33727:54-791(+)